MKNTSDFKTTLELTAEELFVIHGFVSGWLESSGATEKLLAKIEAALPMAIRAPFKND